MQVIAQSLQHKDRLLREIYGAEHLIKWNSAFARTQVQVTAPQSETGAARISRDAHIVLNVKMRRQRRQPLNTLKIVKTIPLR